jgi:hypothetical protein
MKRLLTLRGQRVVIAVTAATGWRKLAPLLVIRAH